MNRHQRRRQAARGGGFSEVALPPGRIVSPVSGTVRWQDGTAIGVWGQDFPADLSVIEGDGTLRPLTKAEARLAARTVA